MENDIAAKRLAIEFIARCRGDGQTLETIAHAAGWVLQLVAHLEAQRKTRPAIVPDYLSDQR
jgi:hypothetical protein